MGRLVRVGIGTDVHAFARPESGRTMWLGCVEWPGETGLEGHSDGDVAAHDQLAEFGQLRAQVHAYVRALS